KTAAANTVRLMAHVLSGHGLYQRAARCAERAMRPLPGLSAAGDRDLVVPHDRAVGLVDPAHLQGVAAAIGVMHAGQLAVLRADLLERSVGAELERAQVLEQLDRVGAPPLALAVEHAVEVVVELAHLLGAVALLLEAALEVAPARRPIPRLRLLPGL